jgi:hypothetical protein
MVCVGKVGIEESMATNIAETPQNDVTEFGFNDRDKKDECAPDVIFGMSSFLFYSIVTIRPGK